jgi:hypothetical protein
MARDEQQLEIAVRGNIFCNLAISNEFASSDKTAPERAICHPRD